MTGPDSPALIAALADGPGAALLAGLPRYDESATFALVARLRAEGHDPSLVAAALAQSRLRAAARPRLGPLADRLLLTQDGLEQASAWTACVFCSDSGSSSGCSTARPQPAKA